MLNLTNQKGRNLTNLIWLPLNEYSSKYRISLSTLRRRIRNEAIPNKFEDGKYWLPDEPIRKHVRNISKPASNRGAAAELRAEGSSTATDSASAISLMSVPVAASAAVVPGASVQAANTGALLESAQKIMQELKQAYVSVLHEKEEQIMQLKEEVTDLKTLVKILESENARLKPQPTESAPIDNWIENNFER